MKTLQLISHPVHPPVRVRGVAARVVAIDANWCVLRWKVDGAADLVVPGFAGQARQDGLWQTTCFELFIKALPQEGRAIALGPDASTACPSPEGRGWGGASEPGRFARRSDLGTPPPNPPPEGEGSIGDSPPLRGGAHGYSEFNFSPSERWAAYDFTGYRTGMAERSVIRHPVITARRGGDVLVCDVAIPIAILPPLPWRYGLTAVLEEAGGVKSYWAVAHPPDRPDFHDPACLGATLAAPTGA